MVRNPPGLIAHNTKIAKEVVKHMTDTGCSIHEAAHKVAGDRLITPKSVLHVCRTIPRQEGERLDIWMDRETC